MRIRNKKGFFWIQNPEIRAAWVGGSERLEPNEKAGERGCHLSSRKGAGGGWNGSGSCLFMAIVWLSGIWGTFMQLWVLKSVSGLGEDGERTNSTIFFLSQFQSQGWVAHGLKALEVPRAPAGPPTRLSAEGGAVGSELPWYGCSGASHGQPCHSSTNIHKGEVGLWLPWGGSTQSPPLFPQQVQSARAWPG